MRRGSHDGRIRSAVETFQQLRQIRHGVDDMLCPRATQPLGGGIVLVAMART